MPNLIIPTHCIKAIFGFVLALQTIGTVNGWLQLVHIEHKTSANKRNERTKSKLKLCSNMHAPTCTHRRRASDSVVNARGFVYLTEMSHVLRHQSSFLFFILHED